MKLLRIAMLAGLTLASTMTAAAPGDGLTGSRHDWGGTAVVTDPTTGVKSGGTTVLMYFQSDPALPPPPSSYGPAAYSVSSNVTIWKAYTPGATDVPVIPGYSATGATQAVDRIQIGQCTRCHTPHRAKSTLLLWNHTLPTTQYSWDQATTTAGTTFAAFKGDTYKGPTTKCLSCHDGTLSSTDGMWFGRKMNADTKRPPSGDPMLNKTVAQNGVAGGNLSGMHPVAMPYPFAGQGSTYNGVTSRLTGVDGDGLTIGEWQDNPAIKGVRLFKDDGAGNITAGAVAGKAGMECSSCHDVHNGKRTKDAFLVTGKLGGKATDGYICQSCHKK